MHLHALPHQMRLHLLCLLKRGASAWAGTMVFKGIVSSRLAPFNPNHLAFLCCAYCCNSVIALKHPAPTPPATLSQPPLPPPQPIDDLSENLPFENACSSVCMYLLPPVQCAHKLSFPLNIPTQPWGTATDLTGVLFSNNSLLSGPTK